MRRLDLPSPQADALHDAPSRLSNLRRIDGFIFHQRIFHRVQRYPYCQSGSDERDCSYVQSALSLLIDDTRGFIRHMFPFATLYGRGTLRPGYRVQQRTRVSPKPHWVTMLRARLVATFNVVRRR